MINLDLIRRKMWEHTFNKLLEQEKKQKNLEIEVLEPKAYKVVEIVCEQRPEIRAYLYPSGDSGCDYGYGRNSSLLLLPPPEVVKTSYNKYNHRGDKKKRWTPRIVSNDFRR